MKTPIPGTGSWNNRAALTSIKVTTPDSDDNQIWLQSSIAPTTKLLRGRNNAETFSFTADSLQQISNRGGELATVIIDCEACGESGIFVGSNRRSGRVMRAGERLTLRLRPDEVLTVRSLDAIEPRSRDSDGNAVRLRPGQSLVF